MAAPGVGVRTEQSVTKGKWTWAAAAVVAGAVLVGGAAGSSMGAPATRPATTRPAGKSHRKMFKPFSEMTSLTPQQQDQIAKEKYASKKKASAASQPSK